MRHEAFVYDTDPAMLAVAVPFMREGIDAGEATILAVNPREEQLIVEALGERAGAIAVMGAGVYRSARNAIWTSRSLYLRLIEEGAPAVRIVGALPFRNSTGWVDWARYEASVNLMLADLPVWTLCLYDRRRVSPDVIADVESLHPYLVSAPGVRHASPGYQDPARFVLSRDEDEDGPDA